MSTPGPSPTGMRRVNRGRNHSYTIDGHKAVGVTTAISKGVPKPALPYWAAKAVAAHVADNPSIWEQMVVDMGREGVVNALKNIPWTQRDTAAARGTEVHALAEQLVRGEPADIPEHLAGYVDSAVKFMDAWKPNPILTEVVVGSRQWGYCGTLDLVADIDGVRWLLDWKTSRSGIFPETGLQLAAYRYAESYVVKEPTQLTVANPGLEIPMTEVDIEVCGAVWLRPDGYDLIPVQAGPQQFQFFLHALWIARNTDAMASWVGEAMYR